MSYSSGYRELEKFNESCCFFLNSSFFPIVFVGKERPIMQFLILNDVPIFKMLTLHTKQNQT